MWRDSCEFLVSSFERSCRLQAASLKLQDLQAQCLKQLDKGDFSPLFFSGTEYFDQKLMINFKHLKVWQKGVSIAALSYKFIEAFPAEEKFALSRQITRAAVSIPSNIAEGSSRSSQREQKHFIEISLGSCFELETQILISRILGIGNQVIGDDLIKQVDEEQKMLLSFMSKLKS